MAQRICPVCERVLPSSNLNEIYQCAYCGAEIDLNQNSVTVDAQGLYDIAQDAEDREDYREAYRFYSILTEKRPEQYLAWIGRGFSYGMLSTQTNRTFSKASHYIDTGMEVYKKLTSSETFVKELLILDDYLYDPLTFDAGPSAFLYSKGYGKYRQLAQYAVSMAVNNYLYSTDYSENWYERYEKKKKTAKELSEVALDAFYLFIRAYEFYREYGIAPGTEIDSKINGMIKSTCSLHITYCKISRIEPQVEYVKSLLQGHSDLENDEEIIQQLKRADEAKVDASSTTRNALHNNQPNPSPELKTTQQYNWLNREFIIGGMVLLILTIILLVVLK